ncbi:hypothetical protein PS726_00590 [Pseudomonas fluorescens]|nr:hypothetical protein PS726_00590 [Pseudomonas fluorescens]
MSELMEMRTLLGIRAHWRGEFTPKSGGGGIQIKGQSCDTTAAQHPIAALPSGVNEPL